MAASQLTLNKASSAGRAATLIAAVYGQHVEGLTIAQGDKLELKSSSPSSITSLLEVTSTLIRAAGKEKEAFGTTGKEQVVAFLAKVGNGDFENEQGIKAADEELSSKTFIVGNKVTVADLSLFAAVHPTLASATHSQHLSHPSLSRHFDHIQHLPLVLPHLTSIFETGTVGIDTNNVPIVEIKPEVKVKKPKADAVEGVPKEVKKEKKEVVEQVKTEIDTVPAVAVGEGSQGKKAKKADKPKKAPAAAPVNEAPAPWMVDLRVGKIVEVKVHPDADSLYVEKIDVGEEEPRTVVSGLVKYMTLEQMQGATLITVCNLKPASMRGVKSFAMVLCATSAEGKDAGIEFLAPPPGSVPGDRVYFEGFEDQQPLELLNPKKKIFETVQPGFTTLDTKEGAWVNPETKNVHKIVTKKGSCATKNFVGATLS